HGRAGWGLRHRTDLAIPPVARRAPRSGGAAAPPASGPADRASSAAPSGRANALRAGFNDVVGAAIFFALRAEGQPELFLERPGKQAPHGVWLPSGWRDYVCDGRILGPAQQGDDLRLLRGARFRR